MNAAHPPNRDGQQPGPRASLGRLVAEDQGLLDDALALVEPKLKRSRIELEETLDQRLNAAVGTGIFARLALLSACFVLVALSLWLGSRLGQTAWGFLAVGGTLLVASRVARAAHPALFHIGDRKAVVSDRRLVPGAAAGRPRGAGPTTQDG